jgi:hypothetical protein
MHDKRTITLKLFELNYLLSNLAQLKHQLPRYQGNGDHQLGTGFFVHKRIVSAVRRGKFISDRMSYIILRGRWCNIIVLNVHAPCEGKGYDVKDSFHEEI